MFLLFIIASAIIMVADAINPKDFKDYINNIEE
jgi:hypothetical protein